MACIVRESGDQGSRREGCCELVAVERIPVIGVKEGISVTRGFGGESIGGLGDALYTGGLFGDGFGRGSIRGMGDALYTSRLSSEEYALENGKLRAVRGVFCWN
jgi:hypothetical protein